MLVVHRHIDINIVFLSAVLVVVVVVRGKLNRERVPRDSINIYPGCWLLCLKCKCIVVKIEHWLKARKQRHGISTSFCVQLVKIRASVRLEIDFLISCPTTTPPITCSLTCYTCIVALKWFAKH